MRSEPDNPQCELCGGSATVELRDTSTDSDHLYCPAHEPNLWPGRNPHLEIRRYRTAPDSRVSELLAAREESPEHQSFRTEMCDLQLLGGEGACRYYLSKLTNSDQYALWDDEFSDNIREYMLARTNGAAARFPFDLNTVGFMAAFLRHAFEMSRSSDMPKQSKRDRAVVLLLHHPAWSDERIAREVPTTIKQLQRNSTYTALKAALVQNSAR